MSEESTYDAPKVPFGVADRRPAQTDWPVVSVLVGARRGPGVRNRYGFAGDRAVDVEDVCGQHRRGLSAQEPPPARIGLSGWSRWNPDAADRRGADAMAEMKQLALDPAPWIGR
jgi:hypothetical protein